MDQDRFDGLARALGVASSRRAALAALLGGVAGVVVADGVDARRRRRRCNPACPAGQTCVKGTCRCDGGTTACGAACCRVGQRCESGRCVDPLPACLAFAETCKNAGVPCCDGLVCGSGQGGEGDVACYVPAGAACRSTAECVFGARCTGGVCAADPVPDGTCRELGEACASGAQCCTSLCGGGGLCCLPAGSPCAEPQDCCEGTCNETGGDGGVCGPPTPPCTVCVDGCDYETIEAAIAAANAGDVIRIGTGTYNPVLTSGIYLTIAKALTLKACGDGAVTINCPNATGAFNCVYASHTTGEVVLEHLAFAGPGGASIPDYAVAGYSAETEPGGGIGSLTMTNCTATGFKYAISFDAQENGGTVTVNGGSYTASTTSADPGTFIIGNAPTAIFCINNPTQDFDTGCSGTATFTGCNCN